MPAFQSRIRILFLSFGLLLLLTCLSLTALTFILGYPGFIREVMTAIHQEEHLDIALKFVSAPEFRLLQILLLACNLLLFAGLMLNKRIIPAVSNFFSTLYQSVKFIAQQVSTSRGKFVLTIPLACSIYYAIRLPVTYDEAWTYLYFTINSPLVSASFYPAPNNHILFSLLARVTTSLFGV